MTNITKSLQEIRQLLNDDKVKILDKLRLVMLYALRFETHTNNAVQGLADALTKKGLPEKYRRVSPLKPNLWVQQSVYGLIFDYESMFYIH